MGGLIGRAVSADSYDVEKGKGAKMNQEYLEVQSIPAPVLVARAVPAIKRGRGRECRVCLGEHDEEIHSATLAVRAWYRSEVTKYLENVPAEV